MDLDALAAEHRFSGVVRIDRDGQRTERAYGFADRAHGIPNTPSTRFGMASGSKGFTAVVVLSLVADGVLDLDTRARDLLGADLPLIADDVTVEHLLSHRSGIGDYIDEDAGGEVDDHVLPVPVHRLDSTEAFLPVLDGFATKFRAQDTARLEYGELIAEMFAIGRKHHVRPVTDMMLVFVALITAQGIGKMLEPENNIWPEVGKFLIPILMKRNERVPETAEAKAAAAG